MPGGPSLFYLKELVSEAVPLQNTWWEPARLCSPGSISSSSCPERGSDPPAQHWTPFPFSST